MAIYPNAAPAIRAELCRAIRSADDATTIRDRKEKVGWAYGLAKALEIMSHSLDVDQPLAPGIAHEETLPARAVELTRQFLGDSATRVLGLPDEPIAETPRPNTAVDILVIPTGSPIPCRCGDYTATSKRDLDDHVLAMMHVSDGTHHGER